MLHAQIDSTVTIGLLVGAALFVVCFAFAVWCLLVDLWGAAIVSAACGLLLAGVCAFFALFPFGYAYNYYVPVSGTVTRVDTRFIGDGSGGTTQYAVVWFGTHPYKCDDSRCIDLPKGTKVTLLCEKEFQFNAPNQGYICNWGKLGLNN
jgi:hypothetical protein